MKGKPLLPKVFKNENHIGRNQGGLCTVLAV